MLQEASGQCVLHFVAGYWLSYPLCGPIVKGVKTAWIIRLPISMSAAMFINVQAAQWQRPKQTFHELMAQPSPHGSYLRRTVKEHFPVWWHTTSAQLASNGYNFPEMNEYDKIKFMPKSHTSFDTMRH